MNSVKAKHISLLGDPRAPEASNATENPDTPFLQI